MSGKAVFSCKLEHRVQRAVTGYKRATNSVLFWVSTILEKSSDSDGTVLLREFEQRLQPKARLCFRNPPPAHVADAFVASISLQLALRKWYDNLRLTVKDHASIAGLSGLCKGTGSHKHFLGQLQKVDILLRLQRVKHNITKRSVVRKSIISGFTPQCTGYIGAARHFRSRPGEDESYVGRA